MSHLADVIIVGAGAVGLSLADTLARRQLNVLVLERERIGSRASWAGAGMLNCRPHKKHKPEVADFGDMAMLGMKLHAQWAERLLAETDLDVGYRRCGALEIFSPQRMADDGGLSVTEMVESCVSRGVRAERLTPQQTLELEPNLNPKIVGCSVYLPDDAQIRTPRFSRALAVSFRQHAGIIREGVAVEDVLIENSRAQGVIATDGTRYSAEKIVFCSGAWTGRFKNLIHVAPNVAKIEPIRGQICCFQLPTPIPCQARLLTCDKQYLVVRPDGIVLIGSTVEKVGFESVTTPEGQNFLRDFGASVLPILKTLEPLQGWADLRPGLKGRHPILGAVPGVENLFVAAGHYRNGLLLAPPTAELMSAVILGETPILPITWFAPQSAVAKF